MERAFLFVNRLVCGVLLAVSCTLVFSNAVMRYGFGQSFAWRDEHPCRQPLPEPEALSLDGHVYSLHAYLMSDRFFNRLGKRSRQRCCRGPRPRR
jgi:hypothetical protein